jgi:hypothetical protein
MRLKLINFTVSRPQSSVMWRRVGCIRLGNYTALHPRRLIMIFAAVGTSDLTMRKSAPLISFVFTPCSYTREEEVQLHSFLAPVLNQICRSRESHYNIKINFTVMVPDGLCASVPTSVAWGLVRAIKANSHIPCRSHAVPLFRVCLSRLIYRVRPCLFHTCHVWISIGRPETTCERPAFVRLLPATTRSYTNVVIRSTPIL